MPLPVTFMYLAREAADSNGVGRGCRTPLIYGTYCLQTVYHMDHWLGYRFRDICMYSLSVFCSEHKFVVSQVNSELKPLTGPDSGIFENIISVPNVSGKTPQVAFGWPVY